VLAARKANPPACHSGTDQYLAYWPRSGVPSANDQH